MPDIGSAESEDLALIIAPLTSEAASASLGSKTYADADRDAMAAAVSAAAPQLGKLKVGQLCVGALAVYSDALLWLVRSFFMRLCALMPLVQYVLPLPKLCSLHTENKMPYAHPILMS